MSDSDAPQDNAAGNVEVSAPAPAPAAAPAASPAAAPAASPAAAFDNIMSAVKIMADPLGLAGLTTDLKVSMDKIIDAAQTAPATLPVVVAAETQRLSMLLVKVQMDNFKMFPDISAKITEILAALAKGDVAGILAPSQTLLSLAPTTTAAAPVGDIASTLITNLLTNPLLLAQIKQMNDVTDQLNTVLANSEIVKYNENMKKLTSALFPLLAVKQ
jgi:hypothetical protein